MMGIHNSYDIMYDDGMAGRLQAKPSENVNFQFTSAEIHLNSYYHGLNKKKSDKADQESSKVMP